MDSSPLQGRLDVISDILRHCPENDFIFLAGVSKTWRTAWFAIGGKQKSSVRLAVATQARARWVLSDPEIQNAASRLGGTLCFTAWAGNLAGLQAAAREIGPTWADSGNARWVTKMAAAGGSLETLQWARSQGCPWDADTVRAAAVGGHLGVLRWATREGCPWDYSADIASEDQGAGATLGEGWAVLELTREQGHTWNPSNEGTCACAASSGSLQVLEWARAQGCGWNERTCSLAAGRGHLSVLKWARMRGCPWDATTCSLAAGGGHLDTLQWAREHGCLWDETTCSAAAEGGHLDVLKWARANGCPWDETTCWKASGGGHLVILQWARANGCTWDESTCSEAAAGGHLGVLQWVRGQGCSWDESTCSGAAAGGHLEVLQWAREQGCPWDETTCMSAAMFDRLGVLRWAREQGCPGNLDVCAAIAKRYRNSEVTSWIKSQNTFDHVWFLIRCALVALLVTVWCRYYPQSNTLEPAA